jgi:hypothetical protein
MTFTLRNRSTKKIVQIQWDASFPETGAPGTLAGIVALAIVQGRLPDVDAYTQEGVKLRPDTRPPLDFQPGQEMTISLAPYADDLRRHVEEHQPFSTITRCFINLEVAYFEDGMSWAGAGYYYVPDPSHPGRGIPVDRSNRPVDPKAE